MQKKDALGIQKVGLLFESCRDMMILVNSKTGKLESLNNATEKRIGYTKQELLGQDLEVLFAPEEQISNSISSMQTDTENGYFIRQMVSRHGAVFPVELSLSKDSLGSDGQFFLVARELSNRFAIGKSKIAINYMAESSHLLMLCCDEKGNIIVSNQQAKYALNTSMLSNPNIYQLMPQLRDMELSKLIAHSQCQQISHWGNGKKYRFVVTGEKYSRLIHLIGVDITYLYNLNMKQTKDILKLKKSLQIKNEFLGIISHDIRSPLSSASGLLNFIGKSNTKTLSKNERHLVSLTGKRLNQLIGYVDDLFDYSKLQAGYIKVSKSFISTSDTINNLAKNVTELANQKSIVINVEQMKNVRVYTDKTLFSHIISNFISNAIKFCHQKGKVQIGYRVESGKQYFMVKDDGMGMTYERVQNLFNKLKYESSTGTSGERGHGLGLIYCKDIAEILGGRITVDSAPEKGSQFTLELPDKKPTILLVDADKTFRRSNRLMLESKFRNCIFHEAENGREALQMLNNIEPTCIITDIKMPVMGGEELIKQVHLNPRFKWLPIIIATSMPDSDDECRLLKSHTEGYLHKPLSPAEFVPQMQRYM